MFTPLHFRFFAGGLFIHFIACCLPNINAQPSTWQSRGLGGGGALFSPSINRANDDEFYVACDMSELFHSSDFGDTYDLLPFYNIQGGSYATVRFTNDPQIRYAIDHTSTLSSYNPHPVKSTDGGQTWADLSGNPDPTETTYSIWADFDNPNRVIIAYYGSVYYSTNGGASFSNIHDATDSGAGCLVADVLFDGNQIYVGMNDGILVSSDGGASFALLATTGLPASERIASVAIARQGATTRFFCLTFGAGDVYVGIPPYDYWGMLQNVYSLDYGTNVWTLRMAGIDPNTDFLTEVAMAENNINTCYLTGSNDNGELNVLKTTNGGLSWSHVFGATGNSNVATGWCGQGGDRGWSYAEVVFDAAVSPHNADKVIITDFGFVHKTADGGNTWQQAYILTADQHAAGSNTPQGDTYHGIGLENTTSWSLCWSSANELFAGFSDIRGIRSTDGGETWGFNYSGHTENSSYRIIKNIGNATLYMATASVHDLYQSTRLTDALLDAASNTGTVKYSTNNGATWQLLHDFSDIVAWIATDPNNANRLYASVVNSSNGNGGVWMSNNIQLGSGSTWTLLPAPPRTEGHPFNLVVLNDGKLLASYSGHRDPNFTASSGVFLYDPNTNTWADRSHTGMYYWTKDVVADPHDATQNTWYACVFSGWGGAPNGLGGLYKTTNRGVNWTRIWQSDRVGSCTINPNDANEMYVSTEAEGLWYSNDLTAATPTFAQLTEYPFRQPERIFFNPYDNAEIWVTSFGNGLRVGNTNAPCTFSPALNGNTAVCSNQTDTYSVPPIAGSTYVWSVTGGIITSGQGTDQISVQWSNSTAGTVSVVQTTP